MHSDGSPQDAPSRRLPNAPLLAASGLSLLVCAGLLVYGSGRGLDLTDEIFYLVWALDPRAYQLTYQPFGYLLHPLFQLVRGDLQTYRLAGFAIAAGAGAVLARSLPEARGKPALFALYGAASALTIFYPWIVTPSYNSAANVGAMLIIAGLLQALENAIGRRIAGALACGSGLCLAAFGKPPLFAVAVLVIGLTCLLARRARTPLLGALALGAALISLILSPAEWVALVGRISASQHILALPNTPLALPAKVARDALSVAPTLIAAALAAALGLGLRRWAWSVWLGYAAMALSLGYLASIGPDAIDGDLPDFLGLSLVTLAAGYAGVLRPAAPSEPFPVGLLLAAPLAVALGTFNNQWFQLNFSMGFPLLALFALAAADPAPWRRHLARALAVAAPVAVLLLAAFHPYSLPASIFEQQTPIQAPLANGVLRVDPETAAFVRSARGLAPGALLVDLSGTGPGVSAVLGARAPVLPWLNPATPTWPDVVWSRLTPAERESAAFVVPIWPALAPSAPARWLTAHRPRFCRTALPSMTFWGEERALELWQPCKRAVGPEPGRDLVASDANPPRAAPERRP